MSPGRSLGACVRAPALLALLASLAASLPDAGGLVADAGYDVAALLRLAEAGDTRAAFVLGMRFANGRDTTRDDAEAARWLTVAAEGGLAEAQYNLGILHAQGRGVARDAARARRLFEAAARQGLAEAQYNLGVRYATGDGAERDEGRAAEWFRRAAEQDVPQAAYNLGVLHEHGRGVAPDRVAAARWYRRADELGVEAARDRLARLGDAEAAGAASGGAVAAGSGRGRAWLAGLDPAHYTIQILSHTDEDSVKRFVERRFDPREAVYFAREVDGEVWFTVVFGVYPSVSSAQAAIGRLDADLREHKPWVRRIGVIQKSALP